MRVQGRESRCYESETRDSGKLWYKSIRLVKVVIIPLQQGVHLILKGPSRVFELERPSLHPLATSAALRHSWPPNMMVIPRLLLRKLFSFRSRERRNILSLLFSLPSWKPEISRDTILLECSGGLDEEAYDLPMHIHNHLMKNSNCK